MVLSLSRVPGLTTTEQVLGCLCCRDGPLRSPLSPTSWWWYVAGRCPAVPKAHLSAQWGCLPSLQGTGKHGMLFSQCRFFLFHVPCCDPSAVSTSRSMRGKQIFTGNAQLGCFLLDTHGWQACAPVTFLPISPTLSSWRSLSSQGPIPTPHPQSGSHV